VGRERARVEITRALRDVAAAHQRVRLVAHRADGTSVLLGSKGGYSPANLLAAAESEGIRYSIPGVGNVGDPIKVIADTLLALYPDKTSPLVGVDLDAY
jgi:hypothetical protein